MSGGGNNPPEAHDDDYSGGKVVYETLYTVPNDDFPSILDNDDDLETAYVDWDTLGANLKGFKFSFDPSTGSALKAWDTQDKWHELTNLVFTVDETGLGVTAATATGRGDTFVSASPNNRHGRSRRDGKFPTRGPPLKFRLLVNR